MVSGGLKGYVWQQAWLMSSCQTVLLHSLYFYTVLRLLQAICPMKRQGQGVIDGETHHKCLKPLSFLPKRGIVSGFSSHTCLDARVGFGGAGLKAPPLIVHKEQLCVTMKSYLSSTRTKASKCLP
jgi:hypothetical protein